MLIKKNCMRASWKWGKPSKKDLMLIPAEKFLIDLALKEVVDFDFTIIDRCFIFNIYRNNVEWNSKTDSKIYSMQKFNLKVTAAWNIKQWKKAADGGLGGLKSLLPLSIFWYLYPVNYFWKFSIRICSSQKTC